MATEPDDLGLLHEVSVLRAADAMDVNGAGTPTDPTTPVLATSYPKWTQIVDPSAACLLKPPVITGVLAASGSPGTLVTITGNNFGSAQGNGRVSFGGQVATISGAGWSPNGDSIRVVVPPLSPGLVGVVVTAGAVPSNSFVFTVTQ